LSMVEQGEGAMKFPEKHTETRNWWRGGGKHSVQQTKSLKSSVQDSLENSISILLYFLPFISRLLCYKPENCGFESRWGHWISFNLPNPFSRTMALVFTQLLAEISIRIYFMAVKLGQHIRLTT
jgi:hypothetical protein